MGNEVIYYMFIYKDEKVKRAFCFVFHVCLLKTSHELSLNYLATVFLIKGNKELSADITVLTYH